MGSRKKKRVWPQDAPPQLVVFSGAGLSAESGLSTFRDADGLWHGHDVNRVCNAETWRRFRDDVHAFYNSRRLELASVAPNAAHRTLAHWQARWPTHLLTQNADDLLERAGCKNVQHLHGRLTDMHCVACGHLWDVGYSTWDHERDRCPKCNSLRGVRPGLVMFGDLAPLYPWLNRVIDSLRSCDALVIVGTSGEVIPIFADARRTSARCILVNLEMPCGADEAITDAFIAPASRGTLDAENTLTEHLGEKA